MKTNLFNPRYFLINYLPRSELILMNYKVCYAFKFEGIQSGTTTKAQKICENLSAKGQPPQEYLQANTSFVSTKTLSFHLP